MGIDLGQAAQTSTDTYVDENRTTEAQKKRFYEVAEAVEEEAPGGEEGIEWAKPDDWGRYGNAQVMIGLKAKKNVHGLYEIKTNLRKLTPAIKRAVGRFDNVVFDMNYEIEHPDVEYKEFHDGKKPIGRLRAYSMFHIRVL